MTLPRTLHGQLFLLGFDRHKGRLDLDNQWRFGIVLRTAMLTDLYRSGYLEDVDASPRRVGTRQPANPLLRTILAETNGRPRTWAQTILRGQRETAREVLSELEADGWLSARERRVLAMIPVTRYEVRDGEVVARLAEQVCDALREATDGQSANQRLLDLGLLAAAGQFPAVLDIPEAALHQDTLMTLIEEAGPPAKGMREAIDAVHAAMAAKRQEAESHAT